MKATATLAYSSKFINRNYRIKVSGVDGQGNKVHKLVGVRGIIELIGIEMLNKLLKRAVNCSSVRPSTGVRLYAFLRFSGSFSIRVEICCLRVSVVRAVFI